MIVMDGRISPSSSFIYVFASPSHPPTPPVPLSDCLPRKEREKQ